MRDGADLLLGEHRTATGLHQSEGRALPHPLEPAQLNVLRAVEEHLANFDSDFIVAE